MDRGSAAVVSGVAPLLRMRGIEKSFVGVKVLEGWTSSAG